MDLIWNGNRIATNGLKIRTLVPMFIPLIAVGTGADLATISLQSTASLNMSINGNGMFYDDEAGTLNPSQSRTILPGDMRIFYVKVTSGSCVLKIMHDNTITRWGDYLNYGWQSYYENSPSTSIKLSEFARSMTHVDMDGNNTTSGSVADLPKEMIYFYLDNYMGLPGTVDLMGSILDLPRTLDSFTSTYNVITGSISDLPSKIDHFYLTGSNTVNGNISSLPSNMTYFVCSGQNTLSGSTSSIPRNMKSLWIWGNNTVYGDLANVPTGTTYLGILGGSNTVSSYTYPRVWPNLMKNITLDPKAGYGLSSVEIDNLLIDLAAVPSWTGTAKEVWLAGNNNPRTTASDAAVATLTSKGVTVTTH